MGGYLGYLLQASASFYSYDYSGSEEINLENIDAMGRRNRLDYGLIAGCGLLKAFSWGEIDLIGRYNYSMGNIADEDTRYDYPTLASEYYHLDDDLILSRLSVQVGVSFYLNHKVLND